MRGPRLGNVLCTLLVLCTPCLAQKHLAGLVRDAQRRPVSRAEVLFHSIASAGVPGLRTELEGVETTRAETDADGRFRLEVPPGLIGTLEVRAGANGAGPLPAVQAGDLLALEVRSRNFVRLRLDGLAGLTVQVLYEGPATLPPRAGRVGVGGELEVETFAGHETVVIAPPGFVERQGRRPWVAIGEEREWLFEPGPSTPMPAGALLRDVRRGGSGAIWGGEADQWIGHNADGAPWAALGTGAPVLSSGRGRLRLTGADSLEKAVLVRSATVEVGRAAVFFSFGRAASPQGAELAWPGLVDDAPLFVVGKDVSGWILGPGSRRVVAELAWPGRAARLTGVARGADGLPVAGARAFVRPRDAVPHRPGTLLGGIETAARSSGRFEFPCRFADGAYDVIVVGPDGRWLRHDVEIRNGTDVELPSDFGESALIRGRVLDAHGEALPGACVRAWSGGEPLALSSLGLPLQCAWTDRDGHFAIAVSPNTPYEVWCDTRGYGSVLANGVRAGGDGLVLPLTLPARPPR